MNTWSQTFAGRNGDPDNMWQSITKQADAVLVLAELAQGVWVVVTAFAGATTTQYTKLHQSLRQP